MEKGDWFECEICGYEWRTRKERSVPSSCPRCNESDITNQSAEAREREVEKKKDTDGFVLAVFLVVLVFGIFLIIWQNIVLPTYNFVSGNLVPIVLFILLLIAGLWVYGGMIETCPNCGGVIDDKESGHCGVCGADISRDE